MIFFSCVIPAKDENDPKLHDLISSIKAQDFPQDQIEILVVTEGDSEQAKGLGIKRSKGIICAMFCADNYLSNKETFSNIYNTFKVCPSAFGMYSRFYEHREDDNSLNRYFALIGGNDVISFYLGKNDRKPYYDQTDSLFDVMWFRGMKIPSLGCNGTYISREIWTSTADLDHYYPMDCAVDVINSAPALFIRRNVSDVWHRTSENLISFLIKRYRYARDLYSDRSDRRWRMLDTAEDYWRLLFFIFATLTIIQPLFISIKGFIKVRDWAWFWHWPACVGFVITYGILTCRNILKKGYVFKRRNHDIYSNCRK